MSANFTKWSNTVKQFAEKLPTNCLSVFDDFVGLALKELIMYGSRAFDRDVELHTIINEQRCFLT